MTGGTYVAHLVPGMNAFAFMLLSIVAGLLAIYAGEIDSGVAFMRTVPNHMTLLLTVKAATGTRPGTVFTGLVLSTAASSTASTPVTSTSSRSRERGFKGGHTAIRLCELRTDTLNGGGISLVSSFLRIGSGLLSAAYATSPSPSTFAFTATGICRSSACSACSTCLAHAAVKQGEELVFPRGLRVPLNFLDPRE